MELLGQKIGLVVSPKPMSDPVHTSMLMIRIQPRDFLNLATLMGVEKFQIPVLMLILWITNDNEYLIFIECLYVYNKFVYFLPIFLFAFC